MNRPLSLRSFALACGLSLSACQTPPEALPEILVGPSADVRAAQAQALASTREAALRQLRYWHLSAKLTVTGEQSPSSVRVDWAQEDTRSVLTLSGPVGIGGATLEIEPARATLTRSNGESITAATADSLVERVVGAPMPASRLRWWVVGVADGGQAREIDDDGRLIYFKYRQWDVSYGNYRAVDGVQLPHAVLITDGRLTLKLRRAAWRLAAAPKTPSRRTLIPGVDD